MENSESFLSELAPSMTTGERKTVGIRFLIVLCIIGGLFVAWLCFVLVQLGEPATSAVPPTGALAVSKRLTLMPFTQLDIIVTSFRQQLTIFFLATALQFLILAAVIWGLARYGARFEVSDVASQRRLIGVIFAFAVLFRLIMLPQTPWLSDDIYRYLWDGRVLANGINPFRYAPEAAELAHLRDAEIFPHVNHKEVVTVYPPFLQVIFWLANQLGGSVIAMKALFIVADLALVLLLFWALPKLGSPAWWAILYAWHPLAISEIAGSGHADGIGALFLFAAVVLLARRRKEAVAVCSLALAFLVKFLSVLLLPFLFLREQAKNTNWRHIFNKRNLLFFFLFILIIFFSYLPFAGGNLISGLTVYAAKWRFNDSVFALFYEPIHALLPDSLVVKLMVPAHWEITGEVLTTRRVDLALFITKILMAVILLGFLLVYGRDQWRAANGKQTRLSLFILRPQLSALRPLPSVLNVLGIFFLLSPTVQPWYLLWILPFLCVTRRPGWIAWSATIFLAYWILDGYARTGVWQESTWVRWMEYGCAGFVALTARVLETRGKSGGIVG